MVECDKGNRSYVFSVYRILLFRASDPISLRESKRYSFPVTVQIVPLSFMAYHKAQFSVPFCFYCTHNLCQGSLTQFPTVNLPMIASYTMLLRDQLDSRNSTTQSCVADVKRWVTQYKLQLREGKTEAVVVHSQNSPNLPLSIKIGQKDIRFSRAAESLGVIFDDKLSIIQQISKLCHNKLVKCVSLLTWNCVESLS